MIDRVKLQNFLSHKETDLHLGRGATVFVGANGAGKSSIIDAITFALYGEHVRGPNEALVKDGSAGTAVSVEFDTGSRSFLVERKLDRKGRLEGAVLKETTGGGVPKQLAAGERKQFDESTTSGEVAKLLGLDYARMRVAAIIQQGELDSIIRNFTPKEFKALVNSLIGIDGLEAAYQNMLEVINKFRSGLRDAYGYDDTNVGTLVMVIGDKERSLQENRVGIERTEKVLAVFRKHQAELKRWKSAADPLREKAGQVRENVRGLVKYVAGRRAELSRELSDLDSVVSRAPGSLRLVATEASVGRRIEVFTAKKSAAERTVEELNTKLAELRPLKGRPKELGTTVSKARGSLDLLARMSTPESRLRAIDSEIRKATTRLSVLEREKGSWEANNETAKKLEFKDGICPVCGTKVDHIKPIFDLKEIELHLQAHDKEIEELESSKSGWEAERETVQADVASVLVAKSFLEDNGIAGEEDVAALEREKSRLEGELARVPKHTADLQKARGTKTRMEGELTKLGKKLTDIAAARTFLAEHKISSKEDVRRIGRRKAELHRSLYRLPENIDSLKDAKDPKSLKALTIDDHAKDLYSVIIKLGREASRFDAKEYAEKTEVLDDITSRNIPDQVAKLQMFKTGAEKDESELKAWRNAVEVLKRAEGFAAALSKIREKVYHRDGPVPSSLRSWALNRIGLKASEYARSFNIDVSSLQLKEKSGHVSIECYGPRGSVETTALSGGEKVAIALALRFGMAYVMGGYKLDFVILDEPTIHLDPERRAAMVDIVSGLGAEDSPIKQTVIISHDSDIFEEADVDVVYRFEKTPEGTKVSSIP